MVHKRTYSRWDNFLLYRVQNVQNLLTKYFDFGLTESIALFGLIMPPLLPKILFDF